MESISLFYRECPNGTIRLALRSNKTVMNVSCTLRYRSLKNEMCLACCMSDIHHVHWQYIYSWYFTDKDALNAIVDNGFKIVSTYYENSNDYFESILKMKYVCGEWNKPKK